MYFTSDTIFCSSHIKETKSATMNIFRNFCLFKSFVKVEFSYVFTINLFTIAENCMKSELSYKKRCVGNYLHPSNNYRQLILT